MTAESQESFLSRWSRRKLQDEEITRVEDEAHAVEIAKLEQPPSPLPAEIETPSEPEEPVLTDDDMPPIESLHADSDFSMFMSAGVSDELRNRALKKLFAAPVFNIRDGLDEYDEDFTSFEKLGDIITCDMKHQIEMEERKKQRELEEAQEEANQMDSIEDTAQDDQLDAETAEAMPEDESDLATAPRETINTKEEDDEEDNLDENEF